MDRSSSDTRTLRALLPTSHHGTRYDPEIREGAYQAWAFKHGQNAEAVARELGRDDGECPGLEARTIRRWAVDGAWAERVAREIRDLAPAIHAANVTSLIAAGPEAIQALREVARGEGDPLTMGHRVKAAVAVLDRIGYPVTAKLVLGDHASLEDAPDYNALSMGELIERQRKMLERKA